MGCQRLAQNVLSHAATFIHNRFLALDTVVLLSVKVPRRAHVNCAQHHGQS